MIRCSSFSKGCAQYATVASRLDSPEWGWDPEVQFLAARGDAVFAHEFRGSTGYGQALFKTGWKQWGLAMQDDIADGVR